LKELGRKMGMLHPDKDELLLPPSLAEYPPEIVGRMIAELIDIRGGTEFHEPRIQRKVALFIVTVIRPENQGKIIAGLRKTSRASTQFADLIEAEI
ncbi:MAG TPA: hypothetical protein VEB60_00105, partial [Candidatus Paceibacterota bacterium]|nr:hypothetical protein [Candidatus Paceibacterota bacterium]